MRVGMHVMHAAKVELRGCGVGSVMMRLVCGMCWVLGVLSRVLCSIVVRHLHWIRDQLKYK